MSKPAGKQTVTNKLDPATIQMQREVFDRARQVSDQPFSQYGGPSVAGASGLSGEAVGGVRNVSGLLANLGQQSAAHDPGLSLGAYNQAGQMGANALSGDQSAINRLMNPYQQGVIDQLGGAYDRMRQKSLLDTNAQATRSGAFGGDRAALLAGERLGEIDRAQGDQVANLLYGGFNDAMGRAGSIANLGLSAGQLALGEGDQRLRGLGQAGQMAQGQLGAAGQLFGMGDYFRGIDQSRMDDLRNRFNERRDWDVRGLDILKGGMSGMPHGSVTEQPMTRNALAGAAGGAMTGAQLAGPWGAIAGGLGGLLFG